MSKEKNLLDGFDGFGASASSVEAPEGFDFFGETMATPVTTQDVVAEVVKDDIKDKDETLSPEEIAKEEAQKNELFGEFEPEFKADPNAVIEAAEEETPEATVTGTITPKDVYGFLTKSGMIEEAQLEEGQELTDELAAELAEEGWSAALRAEVEEQVKELPDAAKNVLRLAFKGGDVNGYLQTLAVNVSAPINKDTDMTLEENQELAVRADLKGLNYDDEYIDTHIQGLKDSGKLQTIAEKASAKILKAQEDAEKVKLTEAEANETNRKESIKANKVKMSESVAKVDNIKGMVINKKDKEELPDFIAVPNIQLNDGRMITGLQESIFKAMADPEQCILLAKVLKSGFDFSSISKATITEYSKKIEQNVQNAAQAKDKNIKSSSGSSQTKKYLADVLD